MRSPTPEPATRQGRSRRAYWKRKINCVYFYREGRHVRLGHSSNMRARFRGLRAEAGDRNGGPSFPDYLVGYVECGDTRRSRARLKHYQGLLAPREREKGRYHVTDAHIKQLVASEGDRLKHLSTPPREPLRRPSA